MLAIPALLRPGSHNVPVLSKLGVPGDAFYQFLVKPCDPDQVPQVMGMTGLHPLFIRKFTSLRSLRDASLECALHGIASQVVRAVEQLQLEKGGRPLKPDSRKLLEVRAIHDSS